MLRRLLKSSAELEFWNHMAYGGAVYSNCLVHHKPETNIIILSYRKKEIYVYCSTVKIILYNYKFLLNGNITLRQRKVVANLTILLNAFGRLGRKTLKRALFPSIFLCLLYLQICSKCRRPGNKCNRQCKATIFIHFAVYQLSYICWLQWEKKKSLRNINQGLAKTFTWFKCLFFKQNYPIMFSVIQARKFLFLVIYFNTVVATFYCNIFIIDTCKFNQIDFHTKTF